MGFKTNEALPGEGGLKQERGVTEERFSPLLILKGELWAKAKVNRRANGSQLISQVHGS